MKTTKRILLLLYVVLVLMSLFTVSTYTWFALSRTPEVSDLGLYVNAPSGLELSPDPAAEEWQLRLDFAQLVGQVYPLRPITWSDRDQMFYAVSYGMDGRLTDQREPLYDSRHANQNNIDGYYIKGTFYARCGQTATVSLTPAVEVSEGLQGSGTYVIGTPVWNGEQIIHNNAGNGAENAIRIGFHIQKTDLTGQPLNQDPVFYIYEPNADAHIDGTTGYIPTPSIDGGAALVSANRLITQTASSWREVYPVQRSALIYSLGRFTANTELFTIHPDELVRISIYVWLEGQDVDCTNRIGHQAQVLANIQFSADVGNQSGLVPIED